MPELLGQEGGTRGEGTHLGTSTAPGGMTVSQSRVTIPGKGGNAGIRFPIREGGGGAAPAAPGFGSGCLPAPPALPQLPKAPLWCQETRTRSRWSSAGMGRGEKRGGRLCERKRPMEKKPGRKKKTNRTTPYWLETATSGSGVTSLGATGTGGGSASSEQQAVVTHCTGGHGEAAPAGMDPPGGARRSQPVHPERVLCGGVGEDHVGVVEHVQSIQGQRVNFEFIQRELGIRVEADVPHPCQGAGQFFG